jgi:cephalosporin-C deacetylase-like acetyl esterase
MQTIERRDICTCLISAVLVLIAGRPLPTSAQISLQPEHLRVLQGSIEAQHQEMLLNFLQREARNLTGTRVARLKAIKTEDEFRNWQEGNREGFLRLIGGLPQPPMKPQQRTPLNARVLGQTWRQGYSVRQVIYESLPQFYVTANVYAPTGSGALTPPYPAVLVLCDHSEKGKHGEVYQNLSIELAQRGYVALVYDPIGQGERVQYWDFVHQRNLLGGPNEQLAMAGIQEYLLGQDLARFTIWDGIRAIDYLVSLPEVDPARIAVTGTRAGGVLTTYISMLDSRVKAAAPFGFVSSLPARIEARVREGDADPEQDVPGLLAAGIDHTELLGMIAPRPLLISATQRGMISPDVTLQTFHEIQEVYRKLGAPDRINLVQGDESRMDSSMREAVESWFDHWLKGPPRQGRQPGIPNKLDSTLNCTSTGQVLTSLGGNRIYDYNRAQAADLIANLETKRSDHPPLPDRNPNERVDLLSKIWDRLVSPGTSPEPKVQKVAEIEVGDLLIEKLVIESEPGIVVPTRVIRLKNALRRSAALVYLRNYAGGDDNPALFAEMARRGGIVAVADVRGFGETMSKQHASATQVNYFDPRHGPDADLAYASFLIGRPLLGMRVWDALNVVEYMRSRSEMGAVRVSIAGRGEAGVVALFAAAADANVSGAAAEGVLASLAEVAQSELYEQPASVILPGALHDFDFSDVLSLIAPRPLMLLNAQDASTRRMPLDQARRWLDLVIRAYQMEAGETNLEIKIAPFEPDVRVDLIDWISRH